ncbi:uncharacterized protein LOC142466834 isoform X1 [Ascaphus truei]|uniref:uncharacterized protein LOC142466834 isoform X1 n=1 Tax=Ascaphus truei TaxID=8439 RepID=UPI003F597BEC
MVDLFKFTRKLTLKRFFSTKNNVSNIALPIYDANQTVPISLGFQDQCNQQDLMDLFTENNTLEDPVDFLGSVNSGLKRKSVFYPSHMRGQYIDIFQKGIERDLSLLAKGIGTRGMQRDNLTAEQRLALKCLKDNDSILIRKADKGGATVVLDREYYVSEAQRQLNDPEAYRTLDRDPTPQFIKEFQDLLDEGEMLHVLTANERDFLTTPDPITPIFHHLPKIHKTLIAPPGRPIISAIGSLGEHLSQYIDHFLQPLVLALPSHIIDTKHVLALLAPIIWHPNYTWVTLDVASLYNIIQHEHGLTATEFFLHTHSTLSPAHIAFILDSIRFALTHNYFSFDQQFYLQTRGTAMGTSFAPSYANLFMGWWEMSHVFGDSNPFRHHVVFYKRYIDDLILIWSGGEEDLLKFIEYLAKNTLNLKFTHTYNQNQIQFLDLNLYVDIEYKIQSDIFRKENARNSLLHAKSCHARPLVRGIPRGQFLRLRRNCSTLEAFVHRADEMRERFLSRGYDDTNLEQAYQHALHTDRNTLINMSLGGSAKDIPVVNTEAPFFITNFSEQANSIKAIIRKHWTTLSLDPLLSKMVCVGPKIVFRRAPTLGNMLAPSMLKTTNDSKTKRSFFPRLIGSYKCGHCKICPRMIKTTHFSNKEDRHKYQIKSFMSCQTNFVVYLLQCGCKKQYVGLTSRALKVRILEHLRLIKNKDMTHPVPIHFNNCPLGTVDNFHCCAIEHIAIPPRGGDRKKLLHQREAHWIHTLNTLQPNGLNVDWDLRCFL